MSTNILPFPIQTPAPSPTSQLIPTVQACTKCRFVKGCLLHVMTPAERAELAQQVVVSAPAKRGQHLYHQGDKMAGLYLLRAGAVKSYLDNEDGCEQVAEFYFPGDILGFDGFVDQRHMSAAIALETVSVCMIPYAQLISFAARVPDFWLALMRGASQRIIEADRHMLVLGQRSAPCRLAGFLLDMSEKFAGRGCSRTEFNLPMSRQDIANYLSVAVETVSRLLGDLQRLGAILVDRRFIRICAREMLAQMAAEG